MIRSRAEIISALILDRGLDSNDSNDSNHPNHSNQISLLKWEMTQAALSTKVEEEDPKAKHLGLQLVRP